MKLKVLYILHVSNMHGSTRSLLNLILNTSKNIIPVLLLPTCLDSDLKNILDSNNIKYHESHFIVNSILPTIKKNWLEYGLRYVKLMLYKFLFLCEVIFVSFKYKPVIIHTNVGTIYEGYRASKILHIPHIWHLREYQDKDFKWNFLYGKLNFEKKLNKSYVICITKDIQRYFNLLDNQKNFTIYNGILSRKSVDFRPKKKYFLIASRISPNKGQLDAIKAFAIYLKNNVDWKLIIAGDGDVFYIQKLREISQKLQIGYAVDFIGFQNANRIFELMAESAALIVPSQYEGFGRMTAEACYAGTTVIGRYTGGTKEILDSIVGYKFLSMDELVNCMEEVGQIVNTKLYNSNIKKSQFIAQELYSIEQNAEKILELYKTIV